MRLLKDLVLRTSERLGYQILHRDYFERERAAVAEDAARKIAAEKAHAAVEIARARELAQEASERAERLEAETWSDISADTQISMASSCRPLLPISPQAAWSEMPRSIAALANAIAASAAFNNEVLPYFPEYPTRSFISADARAYLYALIRSLKPARVAEIGTLFAGTSEVIARALWENGTGALHTIDPFGARRAPPVLKRWPQALRAITTFRPVNSMEFFARIALSGQRLDMVLIDGDHDYEFALFDIQMAARVLQPGGILLIDNVDQSGPFEAAGRFMSANPEWTKLENGKPLYGEPFNREGRASLPGTNLILLQAPQEFIVRAAPVSWGQKAVACSAIDGFELELGPCPHGGRLHYQAWLRAFGDSAARIEEFTAAGAISVAAAPTGQKLVHPFKAPLRSEFPRLFSDSSHTFEVELAWRSTSGAGLGLARLPQPIPAGIAVSQT
jgi:predicted O-methyltransferase YrrM